MEENNKIIRVVGIDFGTSTSLIKVKRYQNGEPLGDRFLTSSVTFGNGEADTKAVTIVRKNADGTMTCGRDADEPVEGARIFKNFKIDLECENTEKRELARQLTESFLAYMFTWYTQQSSTLGSVEDEEQTIISYPVKWKNETRTFMEQAARKAGFKNVTSMDEASAALYTVLCQKAGELGKQGILKSGQNGYLLLVDMGAGTTDLAFCRFQVAENPEGILHAEDISNEIIATWPGEGSCLTCGGCEIDKALEMYVADYLKGMKSNGQSLPPEQAEQIASANSAAKKWKEETVSRDLNEGKRVTTCGYVAPFSMIFEGASFPGFDRFRFEQMISDHFLNFGQLLESGMQMAEMKDEELSRKHLDLVILTGGHSNWYFARDMLDGTRGGLYHPLLIRVQSEKQRVICLPNPQETVSAGLVYSPLPFKMGTEEPAEPECKVEAQTDTAQNESVLLPDPKPVHIPRKIMGKFYRNWSDKVVFVGDKDIAMVRPDGTVYCSKEGMFENWKHIDKIFIVSDYDHAYCYIGISDYRHGCSLAFWGYNDEFKTEFDLAAKTVVTLRAILPKDPSPYWGKDPSPYLTGFTAGGRLIQLDGSEAGRNLTPFTDIESITGTNRKACFIRRDGSVWELKDSVYELTRSDSRMHSDLYENVKCFLWNDLKLTQLVQDPEAPGLWAGLEPDGTVMPSDFDGASSWKNIVSLSIGKDFLAGLKKDGTVVVSDRGSSLGVRGKEIISHWKNSVDIISYGDRIAKVCPDGRVVYICHHVGWFDRTIERITPYSLF